MLFSFCGLAISLIFCLNGPSDWLRLALGVLGSHWMGCGLFTLGFPSSVPSVSDSLTLTHRSGITIVISSTGAGVPSDFPKLSRVDFPAPVAFPFAVAVPRFFVAVVTSSFGFPSFPVVLGALTFPSAFLLPRAACSTTVELPVVVTLFVSVAFRDSSALPLPRLFAST